MDRLAQWIPVAPLLVDPGGGGCPVPDHADAQTCREQLAVVAHERGALELIARDAPLQQVLETLCLSVERALPGMVCGVLQADARRARLVPLAGPSLPRSYAEGLGPVSMAPQMGSCGTAAHRKAVVIVPDIASDPLWAGPTAPARALALAAGLRSCWSMPFFDEAGDVAGTFAVYGRQPCTPSAQELALVESSARLAQLALRQASRRRLLSAVEAEHSALVRTVDAGILTFDGAGILTSANPAACTVLGRAEGALRGLSLAAAMGPALDGTGAAVDWSGLLRQAAAAPAREAPVQLLCAVGTPDGVQRWLRTSLCALPAAGAAAGSTVAPDEPPTRSLVLSFGDVTEMKQAQEQLALLATRDDLTGLLNRSALTRAAAARLQAALARGGELAMLVLDLDGFKHVNDTLGHAAGDAVLCEVAARLSRAAGPDAVLARRSGDEFVLLVDGGAQVAECLAGALLQALATPLRLAGQELFVGASVGAAVGPGHGSSEEELFRHADAAMYQAKALGRHRFVLHQPQPRVGGFNRLMLETQLRYAIERRELRLHYQPRVNVQGRVCGVEALVRWQHPELGLVAPGEFIPLAEETGLIVPLGEWVLFEACAQLACWHAQGHAGLRVSVNVAAAQFSRVFFAETVPRALARSGLAPGALELEVTESTMMASIDAATQAAMQALRERGVRLLLDDFGTGYSSLSYLHRFALDGLKVDRSFVVRLPHEPDARAITRAIIGMARALKLELIAEGVERQDQRDWLAGHGCHEMQGYFWARPLPPQGLQALLEAERAHERVSRADGPPGQRWMAAEPLGDEVPRLQALARCGLRPGQPQPMLQALVQAAARLLDTPMAVLSVLEGERQWFPARVGIDAAWTPRDLSFCGHAVQSEAMLLVEDTFEDVRFAGNPLVVGPPGIRFYAGACVTAPDAEGVPRRLGTLCVVDVEPRRLDATQRLLLAELALLASCRLAEAADLAPVVPAAAVAADATLCGAHAQA